MAKQKFRVVINLTALQPNMTVAEVANWIAVKIGSAGDSTMMGSVRSVREMQSEKGAGLWEVLKKDEA